VCTLPRRFNPLRAFRVPPAICRLIGPVPRVIDDKLWLKLLHAAESLEKSDLRTFQLGMYPFELVQAVATTWCLSGLRGDEIRRLRVGCIRWRAEESVARDGTESLPNDALCFLSVPVNKTGTAFTKPVHWVVGKRIQAWERVRPAQTLSLDAKTNEMVNFLFSFRGIRIAPEYINGHVIPLLCAKANIPLRDAMGKITAHRARATIASALYNAPEGLGIGELGQWLGHKDIRSTQYYAKLHPTRLAKSISRANKNSRLAQFLVDPSAAAKGEPAIFYYLGDSDYCANPAWASCPHRMACLKCPMYVPQTTGKLIEARQGVLRLLAEVPLSDEEKAVAEGDVSALNRYIQKRSNVPTPQVPGSRYVFSPSMQVNGTPPRQKDA
jgi:integrase